MMDLIILGFYLLVLFLALIWLLGLRTSKHEGPVLTFEPGRDRPFGVSWNGVKVWDVSPEMALYRAFKGAYPEACIWNVLELDDGDRGFEEWKRNSGKGG